MQSSKIYVSAFNEKHAICKNQEAMEHVKEIQETL
jgi:hypothetical protein